MEFHRICQCDVHHGHNSIQLTDIDQLSIASLGLAFLHAHPNLVLECLSRLNSQALSSHQSNPSYWFVITSLSNRYRMNDSWNNEKGNMVIQIEIFGYQRWGWNGSTDIQVTSARNIPELFTRGSWMSQHRRRQAGRQADRQTDRQP